MIHTWADFLDKLQAAFSGRIEEEATLYYISMLEKHASISNADFMLNHVIENSSFERIPKVNKLKQYILENEIGHKKRHIREDDDPANVCGLCMNLGMIPAYEMKNGMYYDIMYRCSCSVGEKYKFMQEYLSKYPNKQLEFEATEKHPYYHFYYEENKKSLIAGIQHQNRAEYGNVFSDELPF